MIEGIDSTGIQIVKASYGGFVVKYSNIPGVEYPLCAFSNCIDLLEWMQKFMPQWEAGPKIKGQKLGGQQ